MSMRPRLSYLALLGLVSCTNNDPATLTINSSSFDASVNGKAFSIAIVDVDGAKVVKTVTGTMAGGQISQAIQVDPHITYRADIFIDTDNDGHCQFGVDRVFALDIPDLEGGAQKTATVNPALTDSRGCLAWGASTLHVTLSNLSTAGQTYKLNVLREGGAPLKLVTKTGAVSGSSIVVDLPGIMIPQTFYTVDVFVDANGNDQCDPGVDPVYSKTSDASPGNQTPGLTGRVSDLAIDDTDQLEGSCASFQ